MIKLTHVGTMSSHLVVMEHNEGGPNTELRTEHPGLVAKLLEASDVVDFEVGLTFYSVVAGEDGIEYLDGGFDANLAVGTKLFGYTCRLCEEAVLWYEQPLVGNCVGVTCADCNQNPGEWD